MSAIEQIKNNPKSVYIAFGSALGIALADITINGDIQATNLFWQICLAYATVRQAVKSFGNK